MGQFKADRRADMREGLEIASEGEVGLSFDHLGVVVPEIAAGRIFLVEALGIDRWSETFADSALGVSVQFGIGETGPCFELIAPLGEKSPVASALRTGHRILNHVAYRTGDLAGAGGRLAAQGCCVVGPAHPAIAYGGRRVQFWISPFRFMIELIEAPGHVHRFHAGGTSETKGNERER